MQRLDLQQALDAAQTLRAEEAAAAVVEALVARTVAEGEARQQFVAAEANLGELKRKAEAEMAEAGAQIAELEKRAEVEQAELWLANCGLCSFIHV